MKKIIKINFTKNILKLVCKCLTFIFLLLSFIFCLNNAV